VSPSFSLDVSFAPEEVVRALPTPTATPRRIDLGENIVERADTLNPAELDEAIALLREDGLFAAEAMNADLHRDWPAGIVCTEDSLKRTAVKFGWALASLDAVADAASEEWLLAIDGTAAPTQPHEHLFLAKECQRRQRPLHSIALRWPGRWEPAIDFTGDTTPLGQALAVHATIARIPTPHRLAIPAAYKLGILPLLAQVVGESVHLDLSPVAWLEAMRVFARCEPRLLRDILACAQMHFGVFRGRDVLSISEEDVRALPEVDDPALEAFFLDDPRGRQLLHVGRRPVLDDPALAARIATALHTHRAPYAALVTDCVRQHLAPFDAAP
jgi:hypothetical protein